jgi:hypothetical protein
MEMGIGKSIQTRPSNVANLAQFWNSPKPLDGAVKFAFNCVGGSYKVSYMPLTPSHQLGC